MSLSLAAPEHQKLFHKIRQSALFPHVVLSTESSSGLVTGWARCCGFNLAQQRVFCLPLHAHFSLEREPQTATLVMASSEAQISLHLAGSLGVLRDPSLSSHFWQRLQPTVAALSLRPEQLFELSVEEVRLDRFYLDPPFRPEA